jgi:hypothetical protein
MDQKAKVPTFAFLFALMAHPSILRAEEKYRKLLFGRVPAYLLGHVRTLA